MKLKVLDGGELELQEIILQLDTLTGRHEKEIKALGNKLAAIEKKLDQVIAFINASKRHPGVG